MLQISRFYCDMWLISVTSLDQILFHNNTALPLLLHLTRCWVCSVSVFCPLKQLVDLLRFNLQHPCVAKSNSLSLWHVMHLSWCERAFQSSTWSCVGAMCLYFGDTFQLLGYDITVVTDVLCTGVCRCALCRWFMRHTEGSLRNL